MVSQEAFQAILLNKEEVVDSGNSLHNNHIHHNKLEEVDSGNNLHNNHIHHNKLEEVDNGSNLNNQLPTQPIPLLSPTHLHHNLPNLQPTQPSHHPTQPNLHNKLQVPLKQLL